MLIEKNGLFVNYDRQPIDFESFIEAKHKIGPCVRLGDKGPKAWAHNSKSMALVNPVPSMILEDESRFLYWLASQYARGEGKIVDLGPLAGGSTYSFASGVKNNPNIREKTECIWSYDLWFFYEPWACFFPGKSYSHGEDILPGFMDNIAPFSECVKPNKENIAFTKWNGAPIEILFIDAAKDNLTNCAILKQFFSCLIPERSIVIQQDFYSPDVPWIHVAMGLLQNYFEPLESPDGATQAFLNVLPIPQEILDLDMMEDVPVAVAHSYFDGFRSKTRSKQFADCITLSEAIYDMNKGLVDRAEVLIGIVASDIKAFQEPLKVAYSHLIRYRK